MSRPIGRTVSGGFSLVEAMVAFALMAAVLVPVLDLFGQSRRVTAMASIQVIASTEAESILDGITSLSPADLPPAAATAAAFAPLYSDSGGASAGGSPRWQALVGLFDDRKEALGLRGITRTVEAVGVDSDRVLVRVRVDFERSPHDPETAQSFTMLALMVKRA